MKVAPNFDIREFVPKQIWERYGEKSVWFIRPQIINIAQFIRERYDKPVRLNSWHYAKDGVPVFNERGFRLPDTETGSKYSQHKQGNAGDLDVRGMTADEVREDILANKQVFMDLGLTTLESGEYAPTWVHFDCRTTNMDEILIVRP